MKTPYRQAIILAVLSVFAVILSGCFLRSLAGNVAGEEGEFSAELSATALTANCNTSLLPGHEGEVTCFYIIDWDPSFELESTATLVAEFGLFGVLIDPLILQVPDGVSNVQATFQNSPTPEQAIVTVVDSFPVQPGSEVTAEPGHKFVILEFPDDVLSTLPDGDPQSGEEFDFSLSFDVPTLQPVDVKGMFTGKVEIGGLTYYVPLYPCVTDFSAIPSIQIPVDTSPQFLTPQLINHINMSGDMTCNDQVYDFSSVTLLYVPVVSTP